jgi:hypothetical protein
MDRAGTKSRDFRYWHRTDIPKYLGNVRFWVPAQPIDATQALNLSARPWKIMCIGLRQWAHEFLINEIWY